MRSVVLGGHNLQQRTVALPRLKALLSSSSHHSETSSHPSRFQYVLVRIQVQSETLSALTKYLSSVVGGFGILFVRIEVPDCVDVFDCGPSGGADPLCALCPSVGPSCTHDGSSLFHTSISSGSRPSLKASGISQPSKLCKSPPVPPCVSVSVVVKSLSELWHAWRLSFSVYLAPSSAIETL